MNITSYCHGIKHEAKQQKKKNISLHSFSVTARRTCKELANSFMSGFVRSFVCSRAKSRMGGDRRRLKS